MRTVPLSCAAFVGTGLGADHYAETLVSEEPFRVYSAQSKVHSRITKFAENRAHLPGNLFRAAGSAKPVSPQPQRVAAMRSHSPFSSQLATLETTLTRSWKS